MNKPMEHLASKLPTVVSDPRETRVSPADAAAYVKADDGCDYAEVVVSLLDIEGKRARAGMTERIRVGPELAWRDKKHAYLGVYRRLTGTLKTLDRTGEV